MKATAFERNKERTARRNLEESQSVRDVSGGYPRRARGAKGRMAACERDLGRFCEGYFPAAFSMPFSADHRLVIGRMEAAILEGGLFALAMPRGSGKTTLAIRAAIWALVVRASAVRLHGGGDGGAGAAALEDAQGGADLQRGARGGLPAGLLPVATAGEQCPQGDRAALGERADADRLVGGPADLADGAGSGVRRGERERLDGDGGGADGCVAGPVAHAGLGRGDPAGAGDLG